MSHDRLLFVLITVALAILAAFTFRAGVATSAEMDAVQGRADLTLQPPNSAIPAPAPGVYDLAQGASDWFQRHPEVLSATGTGDQSDYFLRHRGSTVPVNSGASDWFERHPEVLRSAQPIDRSDYALRHPELLKSVAPASMDDYFLRHPGSAAAQNTTGMDDWFLRHHDSTAY